jgi:glycosyltransferase involved in cell wall biosynthesis
MGKTLRILFLGEPGSANTISWVNGLKELGCEVHIASARFEGFEGVYPIGSSLLPPRLRILTGTSRVRKIICQLKPDILICYRVTSYGFLGAISGFHPLVTAAQNEQIAFAEKPNSWLKKLLEFFARKAIKEADLLHAWSQNVSSGLKKYGADDEKILCLHRGIDTGIFNLDGRKPGNIEAPRLISTRSLYPAYNLDVLIKAFAVFLEKYPKAELVITGDGPEKEKLIELGNALKISENISFKGRLSPQEIADELRAADLYIALVETEGLSSSLLESCACGVFPMVMDMPGSRVIIDAQEANGILLPNLDSKVIAEKMLELWSDKERIDMAMKFNNSIIIEKFDRNKNLTTFVNYYHKFLENKNS